MSPAPAKATLSALFPTPSALLGVALSIGMGGGSPRAPRLRQLSPSTSKPDGAFNSYCRPLFTSRPEQATRAIARWASMALW